MTAGRLPSAGRDDAPLAFGAFSFSNGAAFLGAFGVSTDTVDMAKAQDAILAYLNAHGGFGGRKGTVVYHQLDATSTKTYSQLAQEACTDFTEDHHVFAVVQASVEIIPCLVAHGVLGTNDGDAGGDVAWMRRYGAHYYLPGGMDWDTMSRAWVAGLSAQGYFTPKGTYGLIHYDLAGMSDSVDRTLKPELARHGITVKDTYEIAWPGSTGEAGGTVAAVQNAVLKFQTDGIDHVLVNDINGTMGVFFLRAAQNQGYRPRYGLNSNSHLVFLLDNAPQAQLVNAVATGWRPYEDVSDQGAFNASAQRCMAIMTAAKIPMTSYGFRSTAANLCDQWFFLQASLAGRTGPLTPSLFRSGAEALASRWTSPRTWATAFGPAQVHSGAAAVSPVAYRADCSCWRRAGGLISVEAAR